METWGNCLDLEIGYGHGYVQAWGVPWACWMDPLLDDPVDAEIEQAEAVSVGSTYSIVSVGTSVH